MTKNEKPASEELSHDFIVLGQRVGAVETSIQTLVTNDATNQHTLGRVVAGLESLSSTVSDLAKKLDIARTRRPEMGAIASVAAVIITIGVLAMAPVYSAIERQEIFDAYVNEKLSDRAALIARSTTRLDHVEVDMESVESRLLHVEKSRFTADDGRALEERLRDEIHRTLK